MSRTDLRTSESLSFYRNLAPLDRFELATNSRLHTDLPDDWMIVVADVQGSTAAIEAGRYKDVNTVGAATIMAVLNANKDIDVPFIFGGDGATLAVPSCNELKVREALLGAKEMAKAGFNLDLRVGLIPVRDAREGGRHVRVAKYRLTDVIHQAGISGFGWTWAESVLKDPATRGKYEVTLAGGLSANADFTGFQCRWSPIKPARDFKLAVIVQVTVRDPETHAAIYDEVLAKVTEIFGEVSELHPVKKDNLSLSLKSSNLRGEVAVYNPCIGFWGRFTGIATMVVKSFIGNLFLRGVVKAGTIDWKNYRDDVVGNTDFRKFDGALKMVVDSTVNGEKSLRQYLETLRQKGSVAFGTHRSENAIMTCLVFAPGQKHAHFVDGSDGGYAVAAKELKAQLSALKEKANRSP